MIYETEATRAWMTANGNREAFGDMSAEDIDKMPMSEFARLTRRSTISTDTPDLAQTATEEPLPDLTGLGVDVSQMSSADYALARESLGMGGKSEYGVGILAGNDRAAWPEAASKKSGRTGLVNRGVIDSPKIDMNSRFSKADLPVTGRQTWYRGQ